MVLPRRDARPRLSCFSSTRHGSEPPRYNRGTMKRRAFWPVPLAAELRALATQAGTSSEESFGRRVGPRKNATIPTRQGRPQNESKPHAGHSCRCPPWQAHISYIGEADHPEPVEVEDCRRSNFACARPNEPFCHRRRHQAPGSDAETSDRPSQRSRGMPSVRHVAPPFTSPACARCPGPSPPRCRPKQP